ncbi:hypothetical protein [Paenibacillus sp.]|uniref:hypothetical protein n=1 Tax=Paenibacillus sp. TaxID=58172 RepID=UPI002D470EC2|nr:hypothetical protein [Paenibacillus sp.]HZG87115.1 hypothetical protein [Paenibacillus sp.]
MQDLIDEQLLAFAKSQEQLGRALDAESAVVRRMAALLRKVPVEDLKRVKGDPYTEAELSVAREIAGYVNALADLEEALADFVKHAIKELRVAEEE